jgi:hypothetical protein
MPAAILRFESHAAREQRLAEQRRQHAERQAAIARCAVCWRGVSSKPTTCRPPTGWRTG